MRPPQNLPKRDNPPHRARRRRLALVVAAVVVLIVLASLRTLANIFTDYLWFGSVHLSQVWHQLFVVKIGLFVVFAAVCFVLLWVSLAVVDRLAPSELVLGPEDELVRRYQRTIAPHALVVRSLVALVVALVAASSAVGQWRNYLLYVDGVGFPGQRDPVFGKNVGFFVFKLPFLSFLVSWGFVTLAVITVISAVAHYLNGGIRVHQGRPRVAPQVKAHLSVLVALIALLKAGGYVLQQYNLELSNNGYVQGLGATDAHARRPALELLVWISIAAAVILLLNIRRRGWVLPILAVGLWGFVALVAGTIYPAVYQALKVNPAQNALEAPYIQHNIDATRRAMNLGGVSLQPFAASQSLTAAELNADSASLSAVRLWDPNLPAVATTYTRSQAIRSYYSFNALGIDRYTSNGSLTPMIVAARQVNAGSLPATSSWVNTHLQYTHGYGMIASPANVATPPPGGQPVYNISNLPPISTPGFATSTQPSIYFGLANQAGTDASYVVADTRQAEIDYQDQNGTNHTSHYSGDGGVRLANTLDRLAFAIRLGNLNLLISDQLDPHSRVMFIRNIDAEVQHAAPFLALDSDPYPAIVDGQVVWIQDAYTLSANYPYAQDVDTTQLPLTSGLNQPFNYVRNSVKVVVNAYTGQMQFYVMDPSDPIIRTWEKAFPGMHWLAASQMSADLRAHIRYPEDIFMAQAQMFGRYHITNAQAFYNAADAWTISQDPGSGSPSAQASQTFTTTPQGVPVPTGQTQRMAPIYQVLALPGETSPTYTLMDAFVPAGSNNQIQTLSGFMVAGSDPGQYGKLSVYETPRGQGIDGPALVEGRIQENQTVSSQITLLDRNGSSVQLGNVMMVPVGQSMLYFRGLYVQASRNAVPQLADVIVVFSGPGGANNSVVDMATTLPAALSDVFQGASIPSGGTPAPSAGTPAPLSPQIQSLVNQESQLYQSIQNDLANKNLGQYQADVTALGNVVAQLQQLTAGSTSTPPASSASSTSSTSSANSASPSSSTTTSTSTSASASVPAPTGLAVRRSRSH